MDNIYLGIEFGSTRIKACLIDDGYNVIANGDYDWENKFENGYWTYSLDDIKKGLKGSFKDLKEDYKNKFGKALTSVSSIGISGMMHGFLAFDKEGNLLTPFRTWRNTVTGRAAKILSEKFSFNVPQRWSIAHLYEAVLNDEPYIKDIAHITTLAGYIHFLLTGERKMGVGEASGMFPIENGNYNKKMLDTFRSLVKDKVPWDILDILPTVKTAGEICGTLTDEGAAFIDEDGEFKAGIPFCAPEGDAGTGMVATNAVLKGVGNVSAGTSIFAMLVLKNKLKNVYEEIDVVTTPAGDDVAMVHCNNCCGELDAFVNMFGEFARLIGANTDKSTLYNTLYKNTVNADEDCGGITAYNYLSGEHITGIKKGSPMYFRTVDSKMNLANFMKSLLYSSVASLSLGMEILFEKEKAKADRFLAHGGLFKVEGVAQQILSDALNTPVSVMETAGEGGAFGMALLAAYMVNGNEPLGQWLNDKVFSRLASKEVTPSQAGVKGFKTYIKRYKAGLSAEKELEKI